MSQGNSCDLQIVGADGIALAGKSSADFAIVPSCIPGEWQAVQPGQQDQQATTIFLCSAAFTDAKLQFSLYRRTYDKFVTHYLTYALHDMRVIFHQCDNRALESSK